MEMEKKTALGGAIAAALGLSPSAALALIVGPGAGNQGRNHVGRDVASLVRLGLRPLKICGRWVVPVSELQRWAAGQAAPQEPASQAAPRRPGRPRKDGRLDVPMNRGAA